MVWINADSISYCNENTHSLLHHMNKLHFNQKYFLTHVADINLQGSKLNDRRHKNAPALVFVQLCPLSKLWVVLIRFSSRAQIQLRLEKYLIMTNHAVYYFMVTAHHCCLKSHMEPDIQCVPCFLPCPSFLYADVYFPPHLWLTGSEHVSMFALTSA